MCINEFFVLCFSYFKLNFNIKVSDKYLFLKEFKLWKVVFYLQRINKKKMIIFVYNIKVFYGVIVLIIFDIYIGEFVYML